MWPKPSSTFAATSTIFTTEMCVRQRRQEGNKKSLRLALAYTSQRAVPWMMRIIMDNAWAAVWRHCFITAASCNATACTQVGLSARHNWNLRCAAAVNGVLSLSRGPLKKKSKKKNALWPGFYTLFYLNGSVWISGPLVLSGAVAGWAWVISKLGRIMSYS